MAEQERKRAMNTQLLAYVDPSEVPIGVGMLVPLLSLIVGFWIFKRFTGNGSLALAKTALVVKRCSLHKQGPVYVHLAGRKAGVISWLLSLMGVDPTTTLAIKENRIELSEGSLSGRMIHMIPMSAISNLGAGYSKPIILLVVAAVLFLFPIVSYLCAPSCPLPIELKIVLFLVAIACAVFYYLKKTLTLFFVPGSSIPASIGFRRSVIEGVGIDENTAFEIIEIVSRLIERKTQHFKDAGHTTRYNCPHCGQELEVPSAIEPGQGVRCPYCNMKFTM